MRSLLLGLLCLLSAVPLAQGERLPNDPASLVQRLADPDPLIRRQSADRLKATAASSRPALIVALRSGFPAIRTAAGRLLLELPFDSPGDPPAIRQALAQYGKKDVFARQQVVAALSDQRTIAAAKTLYRLVLEEPNGQVRWRAAAALRRVGRQETLAQLRSVPDNTSSSLLLTLAGWAWLGKDRARALDYFHRAIELESRHPTPDGGQLDFVFRVLRQEAIRRQRYDEAAQLIRQQLARQMSENDVDDDDVSISPELFALFVLHLQTGPLAGFNQDMRRFQPHMDSPPMLYALGKRFEWLGAPAAADAVYRNAWLFTSATAENLDRTGNLLMQQGWLDLAEPQFLALAAQTNKQAALFFDAHLMLHRIAVARHDDRSAAEHLEKALDAIEGQSVLLNQVNNYTGESTVLDPTTLWAEVHWRYLRAAQAKADPTAVKEHLDALLKFKPRHADVALEVVPLLKELGRAEDARKLLDYAYEPLKKQLDADPENPEVMNNLAWLLARCGEKLDEAKRLADRAIALEPQNAAYLDTAAEAHFRVGDKSAAMALEKRALELRPDDSFMREQLDRFSK